MAISTVWAVSTYLKTMDHCVIFTMVWIEKWNILEFICKMKKPSLAFQRNNRRSSSISSTQRNYCFVWYRKKSAILSHKHLVPIDFENKSIILLIIEKSSIFLTLDTDMCSIHQFRENYLVFNIMTLYA